MPSDSGSRRAASGGAFERRKTARASNKTPPATTKSVLRVRLCMNKREPGRYFSSNRISDGAAAGADQGLLVGAGLVCDGETIEFTGSGNAAAYRIIGRRQESVFAPVHILAKLDEIDA